MPLNKPRGTVPTAAKVRLVNGVQSYEACPASYFSTFRMSRRDLL